MAFKFFSTDIVKYLADSTTFFRQRLLFQCSVIEFFTRLIVKTCFYNNVLTVFVYRVYLFGFVRVLLFVNGNTRSTVVFEPSKIEANSTYFNSKRKKKYSRFFFVCECFEKYYTARRHYHHSSFWRLKFYSENISSTKTILFGISLFIHLLFFFLFSV